MVITLEGRHIGHYSFGCLLVSPDRTCKEIAFNRSFVRHILKYVNNIPQVHVIVHHVLLMISYQLLVQLVEQLVVEVDHA